jgi:predicted phosphodiesterase
MTAIISDIHGNLEALQAVLEDIARVGAEEILCLGDVVGYGPNPVECLDLVIQRCKWSLCGNHEWALLNQPVGFSPPARHAIEVTKTLFDAEAATEPGRRRSDFLMNLEPNVEASRLMYVHGSPVDPIMDYVFPQQYSRVWDEVRIDELLRTVQWLCFCGHSHVPFVISSLYESIVPLLDEETVDLDEAKTYLINAGAVGQPRDHNSRACYIVFSGDKVTFHRVAYDYEKTSAKIRALGLDEKLAARLAEGT